MKQVVSFLSFYNWRNKGLEMLTSWPNTQMGKQDSNSGTLILEPNVSNATHCLPVCIIITQIDGWDNLDCFRLNESN